MRWSEDKPRWRRSKVGAVKRKPKQATSISILRITVPIVLLLLFLGMAFVYFFTLPKFPVRAVTIEHGNTSIDESAIRTIVSAHVRHGFFRTSVSGIQTDLLQLPWIKTAVVQRKWPDTLAIQLTLRDIVAKWNKSAYLLDNGAVYEVQKPPVRVPLVELNSAQNDGPALLELYYAFKADLARDALSIQSLNETAYHEYHVLLNNGIVLYLGDTDLQARVHRFVKTYPIELADKSNRIDYVDLRYENGMAVGWKNST